MDIAYECCKASALWKNIKTNSLLCFANFSERIIQCKDDFNFLTTAQSDPVGFRNEYY